MLITSASLLLAAALLAFAWANRRRGQSADRDGEAGGSFYVS